MIRGYRHRRRMALDPSVRPSPSWLPTSWSVVSRAAFVPPEKVLRVVGSPSSLVNGAFAVPFDRVVLFNGPDLVASGLAANVEFDLIGDFAAKSAGGSIPGAPTPSAALGPVPAGYRGVVDGIAPFVSDLAGNRADVTPQQLGFQVLWRVRVNGMLASPYDNIAYIVAPWHQLALRPLLENNQGDTITATVQCVAAAYAQIGQIGIRMRGRWVPWDDEKGRPRAPQQY